MRDHHHVVTQAFHLLHDVGRKDDALAVLVAQTAQRLAQCPCGQHVQPVGGFVEHDVGGVVHQRAGKCGLHALTLAEAFGSAVEQGRHVQHFGKRLRPCMRCAVSHAVQATEVDDVLARRQAWVQATSVAEHAHARQCLHGLGGHFDAIDHHAPGVRLDHCGGDAQRGGLARAVGAQQPGDATVGRLELHAGNGLHYTPVAAAAGAELLVQRLHFYHRAAPPPRCR